MAAVVVLLLVLAAAVVAGVVLYRRKQQREAADMDGSVRETDVPSLSSSATSGGGQYQQRLLD